MKFITPLVSIRVLTLNLNLIKANNSPNEIYCIYIYLGLSNKTIITRMSRKSTGYNNKIYLVRVESGTIVTEVDNNGWLKKINQVRQNGIYLSVICTIGYTCVVVNLKRSTICEAGKIKIVEDWLSL